MKTWSVRMQAIIVVVVMGATTVVLEVPANATHAVPNGSGAPQAGTHESTPPSPPIPLGVTGTCQEHIAWEAVANVPINLWDPLKAQHRHIEFITGDMPLINMCYPEYRQFALRASAGTDGQSSTGMADHGETIDQSWSSSSRYCSDQGVADGFPENVNKGTVKWDYGSRISGSHGDCLENWFKFVGGTAADEGALAGEYVLWGRLGDNGDPVDDGPPVCFRADLARVTETGSNAVQYQGTMVRFEPGAFIDSRTGYLGAWGQCDGPTVPPTLHSPADGATIDAGLVDGVIFDVSYEPVDNWYMADMSNRKCRYSPVVEVTTASGETVVLSSGGDWSCRDDVGGPVAELPPGEYTWTAWAYVQHNREGVLGRTPKATTPRSFTVAGI